MDMKTFSVTQTVLDDLDEETKAKTYESKVVGQLSVKGLYVFQKLIFWSCILCLLLFYPTNLRLYISAGIIVLGGIFYGLLIHYAMRISDEFFATLTPTWTAFMPCVRSAGRNTMSVPELRLRKKASPKNNYYAFLLPITKDKSSSDNDHRIGFILTGRTQTYA